MSWEKRSRPGASPLNPLPSDSKVASGKMDIIVARTFSGSSLGFTGQEMLTRVMDSTPTAEYINKKKNGMEAPENDACPTATTTNKRPIPMRAS